MDEFIQFNSTSHKGNINAHKASFGTPGEGKTTTTTEAITTRRPKSKNTKIQKQKMTSMTMKT